jgi:predicted small lipoprotein YifL
MLRYVTLTFVSLMLAACGTKGPLFLPPSQPTPAVTNTPAPAAQSELPERDPIGKGQ